MWQSILSSLEKKATQWGSFVIPFSVNYILKYDFRISGSQDLWLNWQLIDSVEFKVFFLDTELKFALAKRGKVYNYGQKRNNKSTVTTFFPPHTFTGIYLNIQLLKTRRDCNFSGNSPATLWVYEAISTVIFCFSKVCVWNVFFPLVLKIKKRRQTVKSTEVLPMLLFLHLQD